MHLPFGVGMNMVVNKAKVMSETHGPKSKAYLVPFDFPNLVYALGYIIISYKLIKFHRIYNN